MSNNSFIISHFGSKYLFTSNNETLIGKLVNSYKASAYLDQKYDAIVEISLLEKKSILKIAKTLLARVNDMKFPSLGEDIYFDLGDDGFGFIVHGSDEQIVVVLKHGTHHVRIYFSSIEYFDFAESICELFLVTKIMEKDKLVLHASCIKFPERTIIVAGPSGSGKTTLALASCLHGAKIVENENTVICISNGRVKVSNFSQQVKIKPTSIELFKTVNLDAQAISQNKSNYAYAASFNENSIIVFPEFASESKVEQISRHNEAFGKLLGCVNVQKTPGLRVNYKRVNYYLSSLYKTGKAVKMHIKPNDIASTIDMMGYLKTC